MRKGLDSWRRTGMGQFLPSILTGLAAALSKAGQTEEALKLVCAALDRIDTTGERWFEAEARRVAGELLLSLAGRQAEGEARLLQALEVARRQSARFFELRAATSLARWWRGRGKRNEARELLAPVRGWFTEGFDTADLKDARRLLDELAAER